MLLKSILVFTAMLAASPAFANQTFTAKVVGISDGDTLTVLSGKPCTGGQYCKEDKKQLKIRLAEIDAPESKQPYGAKAKKALSDLVFGKTVVIKSSGIDRYNRAIGNIYLDKTWINGEMVSQGHAWVYRQYAKSPELLLLEAKAQQQGIGLWSLPRKDRMPPWEWRRARK